MCLELEVCRPKCRQDEKEFCGQSPLAMGPALLLMFCAVAVNFCLGRSAICQPSSDSKCDTSPRAFPSVVLNLAVLPTYLSSSLIPSKLAKDSNLISLQIHVKGGLNGVMCSSPNTHHKCWLNTTPQICSRLSELGIEIAFEPRLSHIQQPCAYMKNVFSHPLYTTWIHMNY